MAVEGGTPLIELLFLHYTPCSERMRASPDLTPDGERVRRIPAGCTTALYLTRQNAIVSN